MGMLWKNIFRSNGLRIPFLLIAFLIIAVVVLIIIFRGRPVEEVSVSGIIEATEVVISSKVTAKIANVYISEGDQVKKEELLVRLRDDEFQDQVRQVEAALAAAQARLNEALAGTRPEEIRQARAQVAQTESAVAGAGKTLSIAEENFAESRELLARLEAAQTNYNASTAAYQQAQAAVKQAEAQNTKAGEDLRRAQELYQQGAIPANQLDAARAAADSARAQLGQAQAAVEQAKAVMNGAKRALDIAKEQYRERLQERQQLTTARTQYETAQAQLRAADARLQELIAGARPEVIAQLRAQVRQARAVLAQAQTQLDNTTVASPIDGTVITRAVEPGELATIGSTLMTLADLNKVELKVYIEEPVYGRIRLGQSAAVTVDSYPNQVFKGRVTEIADEAEFTPKEIQTKEQRAKLVFAVKITLPNPDGKLKPGMPADAVLKLQPLRSSLP